MGTDGPTTREHLESELAIHSEVIDDLSKTVDDKQNVLDNLQKLKSKRSSALSDYESTSDLIAEYRSSLRVKEMQLSLIEEKIVKQDELAAKIVNAKKVLATLNTKIESSKEELLIYEAISSTLAPTGAPAYVVDSVIDRFNESVHQYVTLVWPNATYALKSYKENKTGDIKAKFSDKLTINGVDRSIGSLSGGELRCLSLAVDFAVIDIVESMFGLFMNPIVLDEPFEGLDTLNRERVIEVLESISANRQIWVIDHASEAKSMFSTIVKVEKRDGISTIV
jgi:DNA repair exonuclease SbcCD ATPase subunit